MQYIYRKHEQKKVGKKNENRNQIEDLVGSSKHWKEYKKERGQKKGVAIGIKIGIKYEKVEERKYGLKDKGLKNNTKKKINLLEVYNNEKIKEMIEGMREVIEEWMGEVKR